MQCAWIVTLLSAMNVDFLHFTLGRVWQATFCERQQALLHGDLHTGSIMATQVHAWLVLRICLAAHTGTWHGCESPLTYTSVQAKVCLPSVTVLASWVPVAPRIQGKNETWGLLGCLPGDDVHDRRRVCVRGPHRL